MIYIYLKNLEDGEGASDCVYMYISFSIHKIEEGASDCVYMYISFSIHKIENFTRKRPILKYNYTSLIILY